MKRILVRTPTYKSIAQTWSKVKPRLAFTLAEVLVVIGIIGMIADLTLPNLIQSYQKQVYVTQLKKAYTVFNQALIQMSVDMGCPGDLKCTGLFDDSSSKVNTQKFGEEITKHMKVIKADMVVFGDGVPSDWKIKGVSYAYTGGSSYNSIQPIYNYDYYYGLMTIDGASYVITSAGGSCSSNHYGIKNTCASVIIDINGFKPPNYYGRDIFFFDIINDGPTLYPYGGQKQQSNNLWWKDSATGQPKTCYPGNPEGFFCAGRIMEEGWRMNY